MNSIVNLIKLHYSSVLALKKTFFFVIGLALFLVLWNSDISTIPFASALLVMMFNYNSLAYEENSKSNYLIYSLPVKPREYILSKYIFGILNMLITIVFGDLLYIILNNFHIVSSNDISLTIINTTIMIIGTIVVDIVVPIALVVGFKRARIILIFMAITPICFSSTLVKTISKISLVNFNITLNSLSFIILVSAMIITIISYLITASLYSHKDVSY